MTREEVLLAPSRTLIMGVVNVTPDSFYGQSRRPRTEQAVEHALRLVDEGADVIDVGGESTRPGAEPVALEEELARVIPVLEGVRKQSEIPLSVDTTRAAVARAALAAGAEMVNDVSALQADPELAVVVAQANVPVVLMHRRGTPQTMQQDPSYDDVVADVGAELLAAVEYAKRAGIQPRRIWIDPGFGFGKRTGHNLELLKRLAELKSRLGLKLLVGTSRKSFIGRVLGLDDPAERLEGTLATVALACWLGADGVRVHDVSAGRRVVRMVEAVKTSGPDRASKES